MYISMQKRMQLNTNQRWQSKGSQSELKVNTNINTNASANVISNFNEG